MVYLHHQQEHVLMEEAADHSVMAQQKMQLPLKAMMVVTEYQPIIQDRKAVVVAVAEELVP
jgi:hypothetical protein